MSDIDFLEHGSAALTVLVGGLEYPLVDPADLHYQHVLSFLQSEIAPGTPACSDWRRAVAFDRWRAAHDLPRFEDARRLAYLVDHYRSAISNDLRVVAHVDLGELWRERRWTHLLDLIDRLPPHSWYASTAAKDEEHASLLAEAIVARRAAGDGDESSEGPSLVGWTPEVGVLNSVLDAVRRVEWALIAVNSSGGKTPEPPKPSPRPVTALETALKRADHAHRKAKHEALAARVLKRKT